MTTINSTEVIANSKFNRFHLGLLIWSFFIILFDGYDLVVYGTVLPTLIEKWNLSSVEAGAIGTYGLFGMMFGAIFFGTLADRIGRKNVIAITLILFSLFTFLCGFSETPTTFSTFRFLAGLGSMIVSIVLCGYSVGGIFAPLIGIFLMPTFGWESIFWFAGLPLLLLPIMYKQLPETASYLIRTGKKEKLIATLAKVSPASHFSTNDEVIDLKMQGTKVPIIGLFKENRAFSTVMFWIAFFSCLLMVYGLNTWLPKLMMEAGYGLNSSLGFLIALQSGAIIGTLIIGRLCDKYGSKKMLVPMYASGAVALTLLGFGGNTLVIYLLVAIAGAATIGAQNIVQAYVSQYYPPSIRSTALGVASGVGRTGGMLGPLLGGFLLSISLPIHLNFIAFAIPGLIAAAALSMVPIKNAYQYKNAAKDKSSKVQVS
ncbi:MFS transporter [Neobacillus drentensis]|uniref:MFS transporter n=1 Tax=Neobacillus drentensis TaxID=220684 RepID=UPI0008259EFC|nr:MFS transporter [Neobacillus drentensis]